MNKRILAFVLVLVMVLSLAACGSKAPTPTTAPNGGDSTTETKGNETQATTGTTTYPVIKIAYITGMSDTTETEPLVEAALNEILRETAGAEVDMVPVNFFDMQTQFNLLLTGSSDSLDIFSSFWYAPLSTLVSNGQLASLDELLDQYGAEILELFKDYPEVLEACKINGKMYALPTVAPYSSPMIYVMKASDSKDAGIDWSQIHDLDGVTEALVKMKAMHPDHYYVPGAVETYWVPKDIDYLGDTNFLGVLTDPLNSTTVENYYESDYFMNLVKNIKIWQEHDIISPDAMSNTNPTLMSIQNGITEGTPGYGWDIDEWCMESTADNTYGDEMVGCQIGERLITTGNVTTYLWHITSFSKNKEAAMRVMKELYCNPEVAMIFGNGIEGLNYVYNEDGTIGYPEGKNNMTAGWMAASYNNPNASTTPVRGSQPKDMWDWMMRTNAEAKPSLALGFTFNAEPVADQITACANVIAQYYLPILNGEVDIDAVLPVFQQELHSAGIDAVIAEKQAQLDTWLASK